MHRHPGGGGIVCFVVCLFVCVFLLVCLCTLFQNCVQNHLLKLTKHIDAIHFPRGRECFGSDAKRFGDGTFTKSNLVHSDFGPW